MSEPEFPEQIDRMVGGRMAASVHCEGVKMSALLDTGAMVNLVTAAAIRKLQQKRGDSYLSDRIIQTNLSSARDSSENTTMISGSVVPMISWLNENDVMETKTWTWARMRWMSALLDTGAMVNLVTAAAIRKLQQKRGDSYLSDRIIQTNLSSARDASENTTMISGSAGPRISWLNENDVMETKTWPWARRWLRRRSGAKRR
ncbi:unnamed protein product [Gongylonema pulchrum]|uniref:Peptidase A2 domain-containing protein n=1 Tax=Gongylonema pulchrum TaxID=637853 RepID=A0A183DXT1_9BILA|nr:unnamed protein product [Gongylonema pulchrum]